MRWLVIVLLGLGLASANGANDGFKGVATLLGSATTSYRRALAWAVLTTALGSAANFVTGLLVVGASHLGLPVSTTHVSCGSLFGIGATTGQAHWRAIGRIASAWVLTLLLGALLGALAALGARATL